MVKRSMVVKQARIQSDTRPTFEGYKFTINNLDLQNQFGDSALQGQDSAAVDVAARDVPTCIYLNLEDLRCFESVERQYEEWGVIFNNCIAIQPSNPAFPTHSGLVVLMGAPKSGFLEATFVRPVNFVSAFVTSSQRLVLSAYGGDRRVLTQAILPGANLANSDSTVPPNTLLSVSAPEIHCVTFCAFDGQFTVDDLNFCF